jgi:hypothetical protein
VLTLTRKVGQVVVVTVQPNTEETTIALIVNEARGPSYISLGFKADPDLVKINREEVAPPARVVAAIHEAFLRRCRGGKG